MTKLYQMCTRCIMDTTDPCIEFDEYGVCNHCRKYDELVKEYRCSNESNSARLADIVNKIKTAGKNKAYDCIIGVSGGVDSTYTLYMANKLGLRPLAVHFDNGWNSEYSAHNIEELVKRLNIDLSTYVNDWEEFRDLQLSFLKASVPCGEIPTDHAISAVLYRFAIKENIQFIITGSNVSTEGILPASWGYDLKDSRYILGIQKYFGTVNMKSYPSYNLLNLFYYHVIKRIKIIRILNYMPYNKSNAKRIIQDELGWKDYGGKHYESTYTRFFQAYVLPRKFNIDKRRAHLSSLICSGQITREETIKEMAEPLYKDNKAMLEEKHYALKKLGLTEAEFENIMKQPCKTYRDYRSNYLLLTLIRNLGGNIFRRLHMA